MQLNQNKMNTYYVMYLCQTFELTTVLKKNSQPRVLASLKMWRFFGLPLTLVRLQNPKPIQWLVLQITITEIHTISPSPSFNNKAIFLINIIFNY